jgi:hypothetical protein
MSTAEQSRQTISTLASRVAEAAHSKENLQRRRLWNDSNNLCKPQRIPVFCDFYDTWPEVLPRSEVVADDPLYADVEYRLRQMLCKYELGDDDVVEPWFDLEAVTNLGKERGVYLWGLPVGQVHSNEGGWLYDNPPLHGEQDLERIVLPRLQFDQKETKAREQKVNDLLGDILPVRITLGRADRQWAKFHSWAAALCGLENLYVYMMEQPDFVHKLMSKMMQGILQLMDECEKSNLLKLNNVGRYACDGVPQADFDGEHVRFKDIWGRGESQELDGVSPSMYEEFLFRYQLPVLKRFGLTNYGCCEDLTQKIEIVKTLPNLRLFICSAWTDLEKAVSVLADEYAIEWRQKATDVIFADDLENARKHLERGLQTAKGCHIQIILDTVMTLGGHPDRLREWVKLAKELGAKYA